MHSPLNNLKTITVNSVTLPQVTYKGQPVLTAKAIAEVLGANVGAVQKNYRNNRQHFEVGKHVFVLDANEARAHGFLNAARKPTGKIVGLDLFRYSGKGIILHTREGLALLTTTVGTASAWAMRKTFIDAYFTLEGLATGSLSVQEGAAKEAKGMGS